MAASAPSSTRSRSAVGACATPSPSTTLLVSGTVSVFKLLPRSVGQTSTFHMYNTVTINTLLGLVTVSVFIYTSSEECEADFYFSKMLDYIS